MNKEIMDLKRISVSGEQCVSEQTLNNLQETEALLRHLFQKAYYEYHADDLQPQEPLDLSFMDEECRPAHSEKEKREKWNRDTLFLRLAAVLLAVFILGGSFFAIVLSGDREQGAGGSKSDIVLPTKESTQNLDAASMTGYSSVHAMYEDAYDVVIADVVHADKNVSPEGSGLDFALTDVVILRSYKEILEEGQTVCIEETGLRRPEGDLAIDGVPLLGDHMRVILFLTEPSTVLQETVEGYGILGVYQGKFFLDGNDQVYASAGFSDQTGRIPGCPDIQTLKEFNNLLGQ